MKKVSIKLIISSIIVVLVIQGVFGFMGLSSAMQKSEETALYTAQKSAETASAYISAKLQEVMNVAYEIGCNKQFTPLGVTDGEKKTFIDQKVERYGYVSIDLTNDDAQSIFEEIDYSTDPGYLAAMQGKTLITAPKTNEAGETTMTFYAPMWYHGVDNSTTCGAICIVVDAGYMSALLNNISVTDNSVCYIIDKSGYTIADSTTAVITEEINIEELSYVDTKWSDLAEVHTKMRAGEIGCDRAYNVDMGKECFVAYAPVGGTDGWSIAVSSPVDDFLGACNDLLSVEIMASLVGLGIALVLAIYNGIRISRAVKICTKRIDALASGDVASPVVVIKNADETAELARSVFHLVETVKSLSNDTIKMMDQMENGDFNITADDDSRIYEGSFKTLYDRTYGLSEKLSEKLSGIDDSASVVRGGAERVSNGAQAFNDGSVAQRTNISELSGSVSNMANMINGTADKCSNMKDMANSVNVDLVDVNEQMNRLMASMNKITDASEEIEEIVKTIEDISFQTNILALNAAVEAAKAGHAGRGFAVVADEVRNLAERSSDAAKTTTKLVKDTVLAVREGGRIAGLTAKAINEASESASTVVVNMDRIVSASEEQVYTIKQISACVERINSIINSSSIASEDSIVYGRELSEQAQVLKKLISSFKLREN